VRFSPGKKLKTGGGLGGQSVPLPSQAQMSIQALPIECKRQIVSYLFPFANCKAEWNHFMEMPTIAIDCDTIAEIDEDIDAIIKESYEVCEKEIDEYKKIDSAKQLHKLNFYYDIGGLVKKNRAPHTHSSACCLVCHEELPFDWPSREDEKHLYAGTCSKECYTQYKKSPMWKSIRRSDYTCSCCYSPVFPSDVDSIDPDWVVCSDKCRAMCEYNADKDPLEWDGFVDRYRWD
jgi:hypothetical protein